MIIIQKHLEAYGNKDIPAVNNPGNIVDFTATNNTDSFKFKTKTTAQTDNDGRINDVEIMVPFTYLSILENS